MTDLRNILGQPINTGTNGEYLQKARDLVTAYNDKAYVLANTIVQLLELRKTMNDAAGAGGCIVSSSGWQGNCLESIPKLKMFDSEYPVVPPDQRAKEFLDSSVSSCLHFLDTENEFSSAGFVEVSDEKTSVDITANANKTSEIIARKAVEYQYSKMQSGETISMSDAVAYVKNSSFSEKASLKTGGMTPENSAINNEIVTGAAMADILAREAVALQKREKESGRTMCMADAVRRIKTERGMLNVPATALYTFTK